ncbi:MAG: T9SS type A sorting domain-containing protein [Bacteroidetes bacterium]|nr:T9SS type A sorting domain-containing protein [Bacteroidota bacterium]MBL0018949.1 T9SS type A sorting domain-containing protein [Bacteroidota bacterium]
MKLELRYFFAFFLFLAGLATQVQASHSMGADLTYVQIGPNQYRVRLSFYRDCSGITPSFSYFINANSVSCAQSASVTLNQVSFVEVSPLCAAQLPNSTCNGGTLPGVQQYIFEGDITLPAACNDWRFSMSECCRNSGITTLSNPGSENLYVDATLNNLVATTNSSPQFTSLPVPYICAGQSYIYNHGAIDPDGDSLVFSLINAQGAFGVSVVYGGGFSGLNPMTSVPAVTINSANGNVTMNPTVPQIAVIAVLVQEYRNGVLIGTTTRDIQVTVLSCTNNSPSINAITGVVNATQTGPFSIQVCPGQTLSFNIPGADVDLGQTITWSWNNGIPGGVFTAPAGPSPQTGTFTWTPTGADVGLNSLVVQLQDNGCPVLGSQTRAIDITVLQGTTAGPDQVYCTGGGPVPLNVIGGTTFTWNILSGTPGSLSCTNCANPNATPLITTTYEVVSNLPGPCKNRDTVVVTPAPTFTLAMGPPVTICTGGATNLSAVPSPAGVYTYLWSPNTALSSTTISNPSANPTSNITYNVSVTSAAGCRITGSQTITVSNQVLSVAPTANPTQSCSGAPVTLNANVGSGNCNQYTVANIAHSPTIIAGTPVVLGDDQVSGAIPLGFTFNFFCVNKTEAYISSNGFITFNAASGSGCCSGDILPTLNLSDFIAGSWNDLYPPAGGSISYQTTGFAPNRVFIVDFTNINHCCSAGPINTFQIKLFETTNVIEIHSTSITDDGSTHTQGIQDALGTSFAVPGRSGSNWTATNDAYRFTPVTPLPVTINWQAPLGSTIATGNSTIVTPGAPTTYFAVASNGVCSATASVVVDVANVNAGIDQTVCPSGSNASLNAVYSGPPAPSNCNLYTAAAIGYAPTAIAGTPVVLGDDQVSGAIPIGFTFNFFCQPKTDLYISSNGFVTFNGASGSGCCSGSTLPTGTITDFIAGSWNDLYPPAGGSISYQLTGIAPNRVFVVDYTNINHCCSAGPINTFQIKLFETSNNIEVHSTTITDDGSTHTMGIQGASGTAVAVPGRDGSNWTATNDAFRFTPQVGAVTYSWSPATFLTSTTVNNPNANGVTASTTYTVTVNNGTCTMTDQVTVFVCILAVDHVQLDAEKDGQRVKLHWDAINEENLSHYVIERSGDAATWTEIGTAQAIGLQGATQSYDRFDEAPLGGVNHYRLRLIDIDGQVSFSNEDEVLFTGNEWVNVSPNPGYNVFNFEVGKILDGDLEIEIYTTEGKLIKSVFEADSPSGVRLLPVDLGNLPGGVYLYRVRTGSQNLNGRLVKMD